MPQGMAPFSLRRLQFPLSYPQGGEQGANTPKQRGKEVQITFHVGPHKTGSSYIQKMLRRNRAVFEPYAPVLARNAPEFEAMLNVVRTCRSREDLADRAKLLTKTAQMFGETIAARGGIVSHEDILGPMPTTAGVRGLYPFTDLALELIADGLANAGLRVRYAFYIRRPNDWLRSLYDHRFGDQDRAFAPRRFRERHGLPPNWVGLRRRLHDALSGDELVLLNYEDDAASGHMGVSLFQYAGLPPEAIARLDWIDPVRVSARRQRMLGSMI